MIGRQVGDRRQLFYLFNLEDRIPTDHTAADQPPFYCRYAA